MTWRFAIIVVMMAGCTEGTDALCPEGAVCATACQSDADCPALERCNATGRCQRSLSCRGNIECEATELCDATLGQCVPTATCLRDEHCPFGEACTDGSCTPGCRDTGDCPLYESCLDGACVDECTSNDFCALGAVCAAGTCYPSPNPSHCAPCSIDRECPFPGTDYCLINNSYDRNDPSRGTERYCGVECADDPTKCPNGYVCNPVVLLTEDPCSRDIHCGRLDRRCLIEEGASQGFCSCSRDLDCLPESLPPKCRLGFCEAPVGQLCGGDDDCSPLPVCDFHGGSPRKICVSDGRFCERAEECLCTDGRCINTGRPCSTGDECKLACISGLCFVGASCAPAEGLYCPELRGTP